MKRNEKNMHTKQKILESALQEFSEKSYNEASLNTICSAGNISKGIIYHYFKDKDELYLTCLEECFASLVEHLSSYKLPKNAGIEASLEQYFDRRMLFFEAHPLFLKLFYHVVMNPPTRLRSSIKEISAEFDQLNLSILTKLLEKEELCSDITIHEVVEVFREYQDFVNTRFHISNFKESSLKEHEERCHRSLRILLYGVIRRKDEQNEYNKRN